MPNPELKERTKSLALRVIRLYSGLPRTDVAQVIGKQALRCGTSVGANYREACRARSDAELIAKLGIAEQELDELAYWLELLVDAQIIDEEKLGPLRQECDELLRMVVTAIKTTKRRTAK